MSEVRNWYIILELEFYPNPVNDEAIIQQRIDEKSKFWSRNVNNFQHKEYKDYLENVSKIKEDMIGSKNKRTELIKNACEITFSSIDKTFKMIKKTEISEETIDKISKKNNVDPEIVKKRAIALGIKIGESQSGDYDAIYKKYYKEKPQNANKYDGMIPNLKVFDVSNLYEFLYMGMTIKKPQNLPCSDLIQRAKEKNSQFYKTDRLSASGKLLCSECEKNFKDDVSKQIYDKYLEYNMRKSILDEVRDIFEYNGELSQDNYLDFIGRLTEISRNRKDSETLLIAFCKIEKIPFPTSGKKNEENSQIKICRCGCTNDISDGRKICKVCGLELQIKCPKCGTVNDANINVCKCGFKFENIDKAISLCDLASNALDIMDFSVAEIHLSDANKYWPGSESVLQLSNRLKELRVRVGSAVENMQKACREKKYYEAKKQLDNVKKFSPNYSDPTIEEEIKNGIETAERFKRIAQNGKKESEIIDACMKAYEACSDFPGIKEIIAKYPPAEPTEIVIVSDSIAKVNVLSWKKSNTEGLVYYSVVRKEGAIPISVQDGILIGRVSTCSINDKNIIPGVQYFYAVFAERAGIYSNALTYKQAVVNLFEISGVKIASGDGVLQLTWDSIAENASVNIERIDEIGKITKLNCNSKNSFVDRELSNDKKYTYRIFLVYSIGATKIDTKGVILSGIPTKPPLPIEKFIIKPTQGNEFQAEWENPEESEIQFFYSNKKPDFLNGDVVPISILESTMNVLVVNKVTSTTGTFKYEGEDLIYVIPVVVKSGSAVIGTISRASKGETVKINNVSLVNSKIMITLNIPKDATGFVVLFRHDQFPDDISDIKTTRKYIPLKQYQYDGGLIIDSNESDNYYFSIFAEFRRDGEREYSIGTDYLFSNISKIVITYAISVTKKLFGRRVVNLTFESESKKFKLPDIEIMSAQYRAPMFKKSGKIFYKIQEQDVLGSTTVSIPLAGLPKETYIKPFLQDENLASKYILKIKLGSDYRIS